MSSVNFNRTYGESQPVASSMSMVLTLITVVLYCAVFGLVGASAVHDLKNGDIPGANVFDVR